MNLLKQIVMVEKQQRQLILKGYSILVIILCFLLLQSCQKNNRKIYGEIERTFIYEYFAINRYNASIVHQLSIHNETLDTAFFLLDFNPIGGRCRDCGMQGLIGNIPVEVKNGEIIAVNPNEEFTFFILELCHGSGWWLSLYNYTFFYQSTIDENILPRWNYWYTPCNNSEFLTDEIKKKLYQDTLHFTVSPDYHLINLNYEQ